MCLLQALVVVTDRGPLRRAFSSVGLQLSFHPSSMFLLKTDIYVMCTPNASASYNLSSYHAKLLCFLQWTELLFYLHGY